MENFIFTFYFDEIWFLVFQLFLAITTLVAFLKVKIFREQSPVTSLVRGEAARKLFLGAASVSMTFFITVIDNITTFPKNGLVLFYIFDLVCVLYLCLINGWSTNKIIDLIEKYKNHNFNPHHQ